MSVTPGALAHEMPAARKSGGGAGGTKARRHLQIVPAPREDAPTGVLSGTIGDQLFEKVWSGVSANLSSDALAPLGSNRVIWSGVSANLSSDAFASLGSDRVVRWVVPTDYQSDAVVDYSADVIANDASSWTITFDSSGWNSSLGTVETYLGNRYSSILEPLVTEGFSNIGRYGLLNVDPIALLQYKQQAVTESLTGVLNDFRRRLDTAKSSRALESPRDVVGVLQDEVGVGQLAIARAVGVSSTAVRKWRRGEPARAEHRSSLAAFASLFDVLRETRIHDPASWLEIPISVDSTATPFDMYAEGRADLVLALAYGIDDPRSILSMFDESWQQDYPVDREYEVIALTDGTRSAVPRTS